MLEYAKREIELAKNLARTESGDIDYSGACYDSALKAFESLLGDGHSGMSIHITKHILNRLIDGKPLSPIEDIEDAWNIITDKQDGYVTYQSRRMSSLFKDVYDDGKVVYNDINLYVCVDIESGDTYSSGMVNNIMDIMYPIQMPYTPANAPIRVYVNDFLVDPKNGDYDTLGILYCVDHDGETVDINRYFKEDNDGWVEIQVDEYTKRYGGRIKNENPNNAGRD